MDVSLLMYVERTWLEVVVRRSKEILLCCITLDCLVQEEHQLFVTLSPNHGAKIRIVGGSC